jgi:hypothetical protein
MLVFYLAAMALATIDSASAALYVTRPVAQTVYKTGPGLVTWKDSDRFKPHLKDMGTFCIDLYTGDDVSLFCFRGLNH